MVLGTSINPGVLQPVKQLFLGGVGCELTQGLGANPLALLRTPKVYQNMDCI